MAARLALLAYGTAAGGEFFAAVLFLSVGLARRPRDAPMIALSLLTLLLGFATAVLGILYAAETPDNNLWALNGPFAIASLTAFVPLGWWVCAASTRRSRDGLDPAFFFLILAALFVFNRYDSLVAGGTIHSVYIQPFVFLPFAIGEGIRGARAAVTDGRALGQHRLAGQIRKLADGAIDLPAAIRPVLALVGPVVDAQAVTATVREPNGSQQRFDWQASQADKGLLRSPVLDQAIETVEVPSGSRSPVVRVDAIEGRHLVIVPLMSGDDRWGALCFVSRAPPAAVRPQRQMIELIAGEVAGIVKQIRRLAKLREAAAADERNRIARELHDSVSQTLYSIAMVADAFPSTLERDPAVAVEHARRIRSLTLGALGDVRVMLLEMRQSALESASLAGLVEQLGGSPSGFVGVELDLIGDLQLPAAVKLAAYRIAQEAITNARHHAGPSRLRVRLRQRDDVVTLWVMDDGTGFDASADSEGRHGLQIMRERAADVGAELVIDAAPGRGTTVRFSWPNPGGRA
ncbi:MAG TPA: GAF domain-containing sensor histidine kinase [Acidimicrobiales bacterium]